MCGVAGRLDRRCQINHERMFARDGATADALAHGPDGSGTWANPAVGGAVDHPRLAIVDLSPTCHQLMHSGCARFALGDNREVYNHRELRGELQAAGKAFRGTSDIEVIADGVSVVGVQVMVARLVRMFAIGAVDRRWLHLTGDRLGIEKDFDEATHAKAVADHLCTDHSGLDGEPGRGREIIPEITCWFDMLGAAAPQTPTTLLSETTRWHVPVALSGDGGDEVFAGYNRYLAWQQHWPWIRRGPQPLRRAAASILRSVPDARRDDLSLTLPPRRRPLQLGDKGRKFGALSQAYEVRAFHANAALNPAASGAGLDRSEVTAEVSGGSTDPLNGSERLPRMQFNDSSIYRPDDRLTRVDRASMAASLEVPVSLRDHWLLSYTLRIPATRRVRAGQGKRALRKVLYRHLSQELADRSKKGSSLPLRSWLTSPLRHWTAPLLGTQWFNTDCVLDAAWVPSTFKPLDERDSAAALPVRRLSMFQGWHSQYDA